MGRSGDEFWSLTYREIRACINQFNEDREESKILVGLLASAIFNAQRTNSRDKVWEPGDFLNLRDSTVPTRTALQIGDEMRRAHALWQRANGTVN